jgi:hypothetical protein
MDGGSAPLKAHRTTKTQTSMPQVRFEPTTPLFERAKTVHALDRAAIAIGCILLVVYILKSKFHRQLQLFY